MHILLKHPEFGNTLFLKTGFERVFSYQVVQHCTSRLAEPEKGSCICIFSKGKPLHEKQKCLMLHQVGISEASNSKHQ